MSNENVSKNVQTRSEIPTEYKWKLEDMYAGDDLWKREYDELADRRGDAGGYRGRLTESAETLLECLNTRDEIMSRCDTLYSYARMRRDEDNTNDIYQGFTDMALSLYTDISAAWSFLAPELLAADRGKIDGFIAAKAGLAVYAHYLDGLFRQKEHILSEAEEEILALASEPMNAADDIFNMLTNADMTFPDIEDENGAMVELSEGRYIRFLENRDRGVRERAFHGLYGAYAKYRNTIAASLSSSVKKERFFSTVRKYNSSIEMMLDDDKIPVAIYDNLIGAIDARLDLLHRYLRLRKRTLGLDALQMYDLYVPVATAPERDVPYEEAVKIVREGLKPLGADYINDLENAFSQGWIDVYENRNKTTGAYSSGSYGSHPYILMNYQNHVDDVLTLAHELGHSMHSYYTNAKQPYVNSMYKIFVAEVASTVNENLTLDYMIGASQGPEEKAYLLNRQLETIRGTLFRQTMFAEFERIIHKRAGEGSALTPDTLCAIYKGLNDKYFGPAVAVDAEIALEWSRIPHFYRAFYVYQYATGISAALSLTRGIKSGNGEAVGKYLAFLASGDSAYPLDLLKEAGVDLTTQEPIEGALRIFETALDELEKLINK